MKLFITGGAGFIGSNFIHYWLEHYPEDEIVNFDALTYAGNLENLASLEHNSNYRFVKGDITDPAAVQTAMQGSEVVVHFAAESHVDRSILEPAVFLRTNVLGTQVLLETAKEQGIQRFHHVSTDEVFGSLKPEEPAFTENSPYDPRSPYSASKASSDHLVRAYFHTYGLPISITNCSNNYGPYMFPEKLIPLMIVNALQDKKLPVYGDGKQIRDWIYVRDHARAIDLVLKKGKVGETYCVGGEAERANLPVVKFILELTKKPESLIEFVKDRPGHDRRYAINNQKIREELGYAPEHTFEEWLAQTVKWYQENQQWWERIISRDKYGQS